MSNEKKTRQMDEMIAQRIRTMPEASPPVDFAAKVMAGLEPKRPSAWTRFRLWVNQPMSMTFTPARLVPAMAIAMMLIGFGWFSLTGNDPSAPVVRFVLSDPGMSARSVAVIGDFNGWKAEKAGMRFDEKAGVWVLEVALPPGDHEYMFLVDGQKLLADPSAQLTRDDGFGNRNSIIFVNGNNEQAL